MRRVALALLVAAGLLVVGPTVASASPVETAGPLFAKACAPAPEPASPKAGLPGMLYPRPATASDADPFRDPSVRISDVYGYDYAWVDYDNGCVPGADALPRLQTGVGNFLMSASASVSAFTHSLFGLVMTPDFMAPLDDVLANATDAIKGGFWDPWITVILLLVAAGVLIAAMRSETSSAVTTVGWALLVLVAATYVMNYPVASARAVDGLVQTTVAASAEGLGLSDGAQPGPANGAQSAVDSMFDTLNRDTFYSAWLQGTLGSSDSATAREHGPDLFRASHLTWSEAEALNNDPQAAQSIIGAKKDLWIETAAAVEREDPAAYRQLTGGNGRWDAAGSVVLRVGLTMPFLVIAAVFIVIAYVATRVFVPLAPGFGVVGLLMVAQGWVIGVLKQVGRFVILGPVFFVAALANLLLATAVLDSDLAFALKLVIVAAIPVILFKLLRPGRAIPGSRTAGRMARSGLSTLVTALATKKAVASGTKQAQEEDGGESGNLRRTPAPYRIAYAKDGPVAAGDTLALPVGTRPRALAAAPRRELPAPAPSASSETAAETRAPGATPESRDLPWRSRRELGAAAGTASRPSAPASGRETFTAEPDNDAPTRSRPSATTSAESTSSEPRHARTHPAIRTDADDVDLAAPANRAVPVEETLDHATPLPLGVHEAATSLDDDGNEVFQIWQPPAVSTADLDEGEEYR